MSLVLLILGDHKFSSGMCFLFFLLRDIRYYFWGILPFVLWGHFLLFASIVRGRKIVFGMLLLLEKHFYFIIRYLDVRIVEWKRGFFFFFFGAIKYFGALSFKNSNDILYRCL